jgi:D-amino peptidase
MRIALMTDMEGVAGVQDVRTWCVPGGRLYEKGQRLLTQEVNAAVDGFFAGGATAVLVIDGHGAGGIDVEGLDPRVDYARGWSPSYPFGLDESYDAMAWVGQHAKASTAYAQLAHTGTMKVLDFSVNNLSVGEFGQMALCAGELGVPCIYAAGDEAFAKEAQALIPDIVVCSVKRGVCGGSGEECTTEEYERRNEGAVHVAPARARKLIRKTSEAAMWKLKRNPPAPLTLAPPYKRVVRLRPDRPGEPQLVAREQHATSIIDLLNTPMEPSPE